MTFTLGQGITIGNGITITYVYPVAPSVLINPVITGTPQVRQVISTSTGSWDPGIPAPILGYQYQWQASNVNIPSATLNTLTIPYTVVNQPLRCNVTAFNANLSNSVFTLNTSNVTPNVPLAPTPATAIASGFGNITINFTPNIDNGGANVDVFYINSNSGNFSTTALSSPAIITPSNLGNYVFDVLAHNIVGNSVPATTNVVSVTLTPVNIGNTVTGNRPYDIKSSPDNKHVYVLTASNISNSWTTFVRCYTVNNSNGTLSFTSSVNATSIGAPSTIAIRPNGNTLYTLYPTSSTSTNIRVYSRNSNTGSLTNLQNESGGLGADSMTIAPSGNELYVCGFNSNNNRIIRKFDIDISGQLSPNGNINLTPNATQTANGGLKISNDGNTLYFQTFNANFSVSRIYQVPLNGGNVSSINGATTGSPNDIILSQDSKSLYIAFATSANIWHYDRNISTGNLTFVASSTGNTSGFATVTALIPTTDNILYTGTGSFFRDVVTGNLTYTNSNSSLNLSGVTAVADDTATILANNKFLYTTTVSANRVNSFEIT